MANQTNETFENISDIMMYQENVDRIRTLEIDWKSYYEINSIDQGDYCFMMELDELKDPRERDHYVTQNSNQCAITFLTILHKIGIQETLKYILTVLDDLFEEKPERCGYICSFCYLNKETPYNYFADMLNRDDQLIYVQSAKILQRLILSDENSVKNQEKVRFFDSLNLRLRNTNTFLSPLIKCIQNLLNVEMYRLMMVDCKFIRTARQVLVSKCSFQIQYQLIYCLWQLSFTKKTALAIVLDKSGLISTIGNILGLAVKEKVIRVILALFRNLITIDVSDSRISRDISLMIFQPRVIRTMELIEEKTYDDEDLNEDKKFLTETLKQFIQHISSFDEYCTEVRTRRLEWTPVHTSDRFWAENASKFNENDYSVLKALIELIRTNEDTVTTAVAIHDIGNYVSSYPMGKSIVDKLGGKALILEYLKNCDETLYQQALTTVQKMMVVNWDYLSKNLKAL